MLIYLLVPLDLESKIFKFKDIVSMIDGLKDKRSVPMPSPFRFVG